MVARNESDHMAAIRTLMRGLNAVRGVTFVLKGGNSLRMCYGSNRFSEDIDLDAVPSQRTKESFFGAIDRVCAENGWTYRKAKDTPTVSRAIVHYDDDATLKVEVSHRQRHIDSRLTRVVDGMVVYDIDTLCLMKCRAYEQRDRIRDVEDLIFFTEQHLDDLSPHTRQTLMDAVGRGGLEKFDYIVATSSAKDLAGINVGRLGERFLDMCDTLELLTVRDDAGDMMLRNAAFDAAPVLSVSSGKDLTEFDVSGLRGVSDDGLDYSFV